MIIFNGLKVGKHKSLELSVFEGGWDSIIDFSFAWDAKVNGGDHWGIRANFCVWKWKIFDFAFIDNRHNDLDDEEEE